MDLLVSVAEFIGNGIVAAIEWATGWRPDERAKPVIDWIGTLTSAFLGLWGVIALIRGGGGATKQDIQTLRAEIRAEFRAALAAREVAAASTEGASTPEPNGDGGLGRDLEAAIDTLLAAGNTEALADKTGVAAEAAIDALIAKHAAARQRVSKDEAALWRQKGALAFLHDTKAALRAYEKSTKLDPENVRGWNELGHLQRRVGNFDDAEQSYRRVLEHGSETGDQASLAVASGNLGLIYRTRGDFENSEDMFSQSLALSNTLGEQDWIAGNCANLATIYFMREDLAEAEAMSRRALEIADSLGDEERQAMACGNHGIILEKLGKIDEAERLFRRALALNEALGRVEGIANQHGNLGMISEARGNFGEAETLYRKCLSLHKELNSKMGMAMAYGRLGDLFNAQHDLGRACAHWQEALRLCRQMDAKPFIEKLEASLRQASC